MTQTHLSENSQVVRAAGIVGAATMVSRVSAWCAIWSLPFFGASWMTDAFCRFRIPNMLRRLLGEGSLTVSVCSVLPNI